MENESIPAQLKGTQMDAESEHVLGNQEEAKAFYGICKQKLFDINNWDKVCESKATLFQLTDEQGELISIVKEGCLIRIDIPGPGTSAGDGYDWVRVEEIIGQQDNEQEQWDGFTVRPCANPNHPEAGTAHFFADCATSTFIIKRIGKTVIATMHGRNEIPNEDASGVFDGLRNVMVGYSAKIGLSYPQWKLLVDGLVSKDEVHE